MAINLVTKKSLLSPHKVAVDYHGEIVRIKIGNSTLELHYEAALKLSQWIRIRAKQCKKEAGDMSRHWSVIGTLEGLK